MNARKKWARVAVWGSFLVVLGIGCNPITTAAFLIGGNTPLKTEMPLTPHLEANGEPKGEIKVAILCTVHGNPPVDFAGFDRQLSTLLSKKFPELFAANGCEQKLKIIPSSAIDKFQSSHPQARIMNPGDLGRQVGADYVFDITISGLQMYEPGSAGNVYQGRAELNVDVYDATKRSKDKLYTYPMPFSYPRDIARAADAVPPSRFKQEFMYKLAETLVLRHIDHKPSDGIATTGVR
jgi:hypothetical protein